MRNTHLLGILLGIAPLFHAQAQTAPRATPPPLGPGPLINRAPTVSQWLMSTKAGIADPAQLASQQTKYDKRTLVRKSGILRCEITSATDGSSYERWSTDGFQGTFYPGQADPVIVMQGASARSDGVYADYSKSDFGGFDWINKNNYTGVQVLVGIPCIVFHDGPVDITPNGAPPSNAAIIPQTGTTAFIAADSRLPILLQTDEGMTYYQWEAPSGPPLVLPQKIQAAIASIKAREQQAAAPLPKP